MPNADKLAPYKLGAAFLAAAEDAQAAQPRPAHVILVHMEGGLIHEVSNIPHGITVRVEDVDTEGGDPENIETVDGVEMYVSEFESDEPAPAPTESKWPFRTAAELANAPTFAELAELVQILTPACMTREAEEQFQWHKAADAERVALCARINEAREKLRALAQRLQPKPSRFPSLL